MYEKSHLNRVGHFNVAQLEVIHRCFGVCAPDSHESLIQQFHSHFCCVSSSKKVSQIPFIISLRPLPALPGLQHISLLISGRVQLSVRWRTTEEVIITVGYCF